MRIVIVLIFCLGLIGSVNGQCMGFAKDVGKEALGSYLHDGNYNATILEEGEKAELYKTFFSEQKYRVAISKVDELPDIHFRVLDRNGNVLFDNVKYDYQLVWDFEVASTQMLIIELNVLEHNKESEELVAGCVSVMFGIEPDKKKRKK